MVDESVEQTLVVVVVVVVNLFVFLLPLHYLSNFLCSLKEIFFVEEMNERMLQQIDIGRFHRYTRQI